MIRGQDRTGSMVEDMVEDPKAMIKDASVQKDTARLPDEPLKKLKQFRGARMPLLRSRGARNVQLPQGKAKERSQAGDTVKQAPYCLKQFQDL